MPWQRNIACILAASTCASALGPSAPVAAGPVPSVSLVPVAEVGLAVDVAWRPDDDSLYVVSQEGLIVRVDSTDSVEVLDIVDLTVGEYEQGLLGLAFAPSGDVAYINYTDTADDTVVAEIAVDDEGMFDRESMRVILTVEQPETNHNGGDLAFGPDGMLYIGMGDGGGAGDPERAALDRSSLLGKMLRIDPTPSGELPYTIPPDNPFVGTDGARGEIWAEGLRNPWRFSFDPLTGDLWIADVGQAVWEEINYSPAVDGVDAGRAANYGWSAFEGSAPYPNGITIDDHVAPIYEYEHQDERCSVSGGARARGEGAGALDGWYVFADYCSGELFGLELAGEGAETSVEQAVTFDEVTAAWVTAVVTGPDGSIYVLGNGLVQQLVAT